MSEARANANQASGAEIPINGVGNGVGGAEPPLEFPQIQPGQNMRVPESEAEAEALMRAQFGNDPEAIRAAGRAMAEKMARMADEIEAVSRPKPRLVEVPAVAQSAEELVAEQDAAPTQDPAVAAAPVAPAQPIQPVAQSVSSSVAQTAAHAPPAHAPAPAVPPARPVAPAPAQTQQQQQQQSEPWPPPGYLPVPEGLFTWTPESWGGRALHFVPDQVVRRDRQSPILIGILMAPAFARNRAGRVVSLPQGGRVAIHAGIAWGPMLSLAEAPEGRPVISARPALDPSGRPLRYELGDGAHEWGIEIVFENDPKNPGFPRLIDLETVKGARRGDAE